MSKKKGNKYILTLTLQNYEGPLLYFSEDVEGDEKLLEDKINNIIKKINESLTLNENLNENPYEFEEMVYIPAGKAIIGSFNGEVDEAPQREVYVGGFYIDKYEVTNAQYKRFVDATGRKSPENVVNPEYTIWKNGTYPEELAYHQLLMLLGTTQGIIVTGLVKDYLLLLNGKKQQEVHMVIYTLGGTNILKVMLTYT